MVLPEAETKGGTLNVLSSTGHRMRQHFRSLNLKLFVTKMILGKELMKTKEIVMNDES
jgi:hypothetical protein